MNSRDLKNRASEISEICRLLVERAKEMNRIADVLEKQENDKISRFDQFKELYTKSKEELTDYEKGFLDGLDNAAEFFNDQS